MGFNRTFVELKCDSIIFKQTLCFSFNRTIAEFGESVWGGKKQARRGIRSEDGAGA